jgi:hypothetical protein
MKYTCPVCGCPMEDEPDNFNICPCCGCEFGLDDSNRSHELLRLAWIAAGMPWLHDPQPEGWNPLAQLANAYRSEGRMV